MVLEATERLLRRRFLRRYCVLLAEEKLYRRWTRDQGASDSAALLSQADTIVSGGLAFALTIILTLVLMIAVVVSVSFKNGGPFHVFLMGFGLFCLFAFAVNVAVNAPGVLLAHLYPVMNRDGSDRPEYR